MSRLVLMRWADERRRAAEIAALANPVTAPAVITAETASMFDDGSVGRRAMLLIAGIPLSMLVEFLLGQIWTLMFGPVGPLSTTGFIVWSFVGFGGIVLYTILSQRWFTGCLMCSMAAPKLNLLIKLLS